MPQRARASPAGESSLGVLPQPGQKPPSRPAPQGHPVFVEDEKDGALLHPPGLLGRLHRQLAGPAGEAGSAERPGWAEVAQGRPVGQANGGPQLHHGLIEVAGGVQGMISARAAVTRFWWPARRCPPRLP